MELVFEQIGQELRYTQGHVKNVCTKFGGFKKSKFYEILPVM